MSVKSLFIFPVIFSIMHLAFLNAEEVDAEISNARTKKGTATITCSPRGAKPGTKALAEALDSLKPGMTLKLLPGRYNPQNCLIFRQDNLIIEGNGSDRLVDYNLILYGKNCIVRNINIRACQGESIKVVDCRARGLSVTASRTRRGVSIVANCALNGLKIYPNLQNVVVQNSTILNAQGIREEKKVVQSAAYSSRFVGGYVPSLLHFGKLEKKGCVEFNECVLYSSGNIFAGCSKYLNLTLRDNIIYFGRSIISTSKKKALIKELRDLKNICRLKLTGKNIIEKPEFLKKPVPRLYTSRDNFILAPASEAKIKGVGCHMGAGNMPVWNPGDK